MLVHQKSFLAQKNKKKKTINIQARIREKKIRMKKLVDVFDLNLVDGLLIFLLPGFEQALCIINHFFQTVLLAEKQTEEKHCELKQRPTNFSTPNQS